MIEKLKNRHAELIILTGEKVNQIEKVLDQKLPAYRKLSTEIDFNGLKESEYTNLYKLKINGLNAKLRHSEEFLMAIKNENQYLISKFDLFNEIGNEPKED